MNPLLAPRPPPPYEPPSKSNRIRHSINKATPRDQSNQAYKAHIVPEMLKIRVENVVSSKADLFKNARAKQRAEAN